MSANIHKLCQLFVKNLIYFELLWNLIMCGGTKFNAK